MMFQVTWTELVEFSAQIQANSIEEARLKFKASLYADVEENDSRHVPDSEEFEAIDDNN